ncbi:hypothetical protein [Lentzea sp. NPDC092896]|uniref:hypothetical protein n=1 Tax=Lentzea sp. NPDC092896 TaxID=3364127 RepID=UPI0037FB6C62
MDYGSFGTHNPDLCACGCKTPVKDNGLTPRYATPTCRDRWAAARTPRPSDVVESDLLDDGPQEPPPPSEPVGVEEVAEVQQEFAERVIVAPEAEEALRAAPSGMQVQPRSKSLWKALRHGGRKVW